jgi:ankyrin repeat protein
MAHAPPARNRRTLLRLREKLAIDLDKQLRLAAKEGDDGRCAVLVQRGASINKVGGSHRYTALHYAARYGHLRAIHTLLQLKADPNVQNGDGVCLCVFVCVCVCV